MSTMFRYTLPVEQTGWQIGTDHVQAHTLSRFLHGEQGALMVAARPVQAALQMNSIDFADVGIDTLLERDQQAAEAFDARRHVADAIAVAPVPTVAGC
jgi:hypothetical protein